ncbi:hypothetical protein HYT05_03365 [Candidatus Kaiserbacteria bacterium]|nr:hypothetical protein [Candidatus Kaiserbacteria bacterium]
MATQKKTTTKNTTKTAKTTKAVKVTKAAPAPKMITLMIGAFPGGKINPYTVKDTTTYREGLEAAGLKLNNGEVRVNGQPISDVNATAQDKDQVLLFGKVAGNY